VTALVETRAQQLDDAPVIIAGSRRHPRIWVVLALVAICSVHAALTLRLHNGVFEDEGLYIYQGHRAIAHLLHGLRLSDNPGSYLSGAPALYPVYAALIDHFGGLEAVRFGSLPFTLLGICCVYGIGQRLFGRVAGLLGALALAVCGPVIFLAHFATYDAAIVGLVALATWLSVRSAQDDGLLWAPMIAAILVLAGFTKYAAFAYVPMVFAVGVVVGWRTFRWRVVRRAVFGLLCAVALFFVLIEVWGRSLIPGIELTTTNRKVLGPTGAHVLLRDIAVWVGPWLALAALAGLFRLRSRFFLVLVLLAASIVGPADQVRIGEGTSLSKHVAFGMVFVCPLIGDLAARMLSHWWALTIWPVLAIFGALVVSGLHYSSHLFGEWSNEATLSALLRTDIASVGQKPILGERPSSQRYELAKVTTGSQWYDTYYFTYDGKHDIAAYEAALDAHYFGLVYVSDTTPYGKFVQDWFARQPWQTAYYHLQAKLPRYLFGHQIGWWLVYVPDPHVTTTVTPNTTLPSTVAYGDTLTWSGTLVADQQATKARYPNMPAEAPLVELWFNSAVTGQWQNVASQHGVPAGCALCWTWSFPLNETRAGEWQVRFGARTPTILKASSSPAESVMITPTVTGWVSGSETLPWNTTLARTITVQPGFDRQVILFGRQCATCAWTRFTGPQTLDAEDQTTFIFTPRWGTREWELYVPPIAASDDYTGGVFSTTVR
jgi:dolichyl-phosphate-mannose-protein mannosyltransferase